MPIIIHADADESPTFPLVSCLLETHLHLRQGPKRAKDSTDRKRNRKGSDEDTRQSTFDLPDAREKVSGSLPDLAPAGTDYYSPNDRKGLSCACGQATLVRGHAERVVLLDAAGRYPAKYGRLVMARTHV
jgi:hypothetical protein